MTIPASFAQDGFNVQAYKKYRALLIGTEGRANTGKTEFAWSAPGPAIHLGLDRGYRGALDSAAPPDTRSLIEGENLVIIDIDAPLNTGTTQQAALASWTNFYQNQYLRALANKDARTVILDGDSDSFEWQMLAEFGRTNQIPQIQRTSLNAARRVMISRAYSCGKIVICTNKVKKQYEDVLDAFGKPMPNPEKPSETLRRWDGVKYERQGFNDHEYCFELQLKHVYAPATVRGNKDIPAKWGVEILMAKANRAVEGMTLWGEDCNLPGVLSLVYEGVDLSEWGY